MGETSERNSKPSGWGLAPEGSPDRRVPSSHSLLLHLVSSGARSHLCPRQVAEEEMWTGVWRCSWLHEVATLAFRQSQAGSS